MTANGTANGRANDSRALDASTDRSAKAPRGSIELRGLKKAFRVYRSRSVKELMLHALRGEPFVERRTVLDGVTLSIKPGERVGIVGRNGAGKSTLFRILSGILLPDEGEARVMGRVAPLIEVTAGFVPDMTATENLRLNAAILGVTRAEIDACAERIIEFAGVREFMATPMRYFSSGMQTRLGFSIVAHVAADIVLIDEALAVGDLDFQKKSLKRMDEIAAGGATVVFVSHDHEAVRRFCTRAIWLDGGKVRLDAAAADVVDAVAAAAAGA